MNIQTFARASRVKALMDSLSNDLSRISGDNSDGTPKATGRHCPLDVDDDDDLWLDDDGDWCDRCNGDGRDPMTDYLLPCPACQGEQH